jgi:peptide deformylase
MILDIKKYGEQVLTRVAEPVTEFDETLRKLVADMFETMYAAPGVGLAAPQVGVSKRLFVMDCAPSKGPRERVVLANPEIVMTEGSQKGDEGCLSFPGIYFEVERPVRVVARAQNVDGEWFEIDAMDLAARCIVHENDHLNGVLFLDYLGPIRRDLLKRKIRKRQAAGDW